MSKTIDPGNYLLLLCSLKYRPETNGTGTCIIIVLIFWGGIWNQLNSWTLISSGPHPIVNINKKLQFVQARTKLRTNPLFPRVLFSSLFGLPQSRVPDTNTQNLQIMLIMFQSSDKRVSNPHGHNNLIVWLLSQSLFSRMSHLYTPCGVVPPPVSRIRMNTLCIEYGEPYPQLIDKYTIYVGTWNSFTIRWSGMQSREFRETFIIELNSAKRGVPPMEPPRNSAIWDSDNEYADIWTDHVRNMSCVSLVTTQKSPLDQPMV
jgi:hypothetical protein